MAKFNTINENGSVLWKEDLSPKDEHLYRFLFNLVVIEQNAAKVWIWFGLNLCAKMRVNGFQLQEFMVHENKAEVLSWINRNVYCEIPNEEKWGTEQGRVQGLNLCHRAVKNHSRDVVKFLLINCGADLSVGFLDIVMDDKGKVKIVTSDSLFGLIMTHFRDPIQFVKEILDDGVCQNEDRFGDDPRFLFGEYLDE